MMVVYRSIAILLLVTLSSSAMAVDRVNPGDWPQWRGPNRDGISTETGLITAFPENGPPLAWTAKNLGAGYSSVSIQNGRVFTMGQRGGEEFVIALNTADGQELWSAKVGLSGDNGGYPGPRCTPTLDGQLLYALGSQGDLVCLEANSGGERWRKSFINDFGGRMMSGWGYSESPLVDGDRLIGTPGASDAMLVALNKKTGKEIWRTSTPTLGEKGGDGAGYGSIVISDAGGVRQYVQLVGRGLIGVRAKDGKFLWSYNKIANGTANIPTPVVSEDLVFTSTGYGDGGAALLRLIPSGGGIKAEEVYYHSAKEFQNHHGGMVLLGEYLYAGDGQNNGFPTCMEFKSGKIIWGKQRGPGTGSAAVAYADGKLFFRYQDGVMALIDATPEGYQLHGAFRIPDVSKPSWPHPVIADGRLYLREQDALYCYLIK